VSSNRAAQSLSVDSISKIKLESDSIICFVDIWQEGGKIPGHWRIKTNFGGCLSRPRLYLGPTAWACFRQRRGGCGGQQLLASSAAGDDRVRLGSGERCYGHGLARELGQALHCCWAKLDWIGLRAGKIKWKGEEHRVGRLG
jgi:hypothetical protein